MNTDATAEMKKTRFDNIDLIKALAILMVLALHTSLWRFDFFATPTASRVFQYAMRLISEGVPLFVMTNGFLLFRKQSFDLKKHVKKMLKMFLLLILWAIILIVAKAALLKEPEALTFQSILLYVLQTQIGHKYTGVLWFLENLLGVYLIFPMLWKVYVSDFQLFKYGFGIVAFFTVGIDTLQLLRDFVVAVTNDGAILDELIHFINRFSSIGNGWYVFYFMLGGMIFHYLDVIRQKQALFGLVGILSWPLAFLYGYAMSRLTGKVYNASFNYASIFMTFFLIGLIALTCTYKNGGNPIQKLIASVGQNTFGIYLSHMIFISIVTRFFYINSGITRIAAFLAVFVASYLFSLVIRKIPGLRRLVDLN